MRKVEVGDDGGVLATIMMSDEGVVSVESEFPRFAHGLEQVTSADGKSDVTPADGAASLDAVLVSYARGYGWAKERS
ncbi:MAG: hypothetical protein EXQ49_08765 [Acidobacteria bacterium]|nr:hypothetical protein [Acidobacteriota bacterium]